VSVRATLVGGQVAHWSAEADRALTA
jgi:hypothetical protein